MDINQLRNFQTVATSRTMGEAAEILQISQPALSLSIKRMEEELNVLLFNRSRKGLTLTAVGEIALKRISSILGDYDSMTQELYSLSRRDSHFSISFCDSGPMFYCTPQFTIKNPSYGLSFALHDDSINEAVCLLTRSFDLVISSREIQHPMIYSTHYLTDQVILNVPASHPLANQTCLSVRDCPYPLNLRAYYIEGLFWRKQQSFWAELADKVSVATDIDYFIFQQNLSSSNEIGVSTVLMSRYRKDSTEAVPVVTTDPELGINYYVSCVKSEKRRLKSFLNWCKSDASEYRAMIDQHVRA